MSEEIWKPVVGYEGLYEVSSEGRVRSLNYKRQYRIQVLVQNYSRKYPYVILCKDGKIKTRLVHLLVWEAFNGTIPKGMQVNHINEIKTDNRLENLNLMTPKENINWGTGIERRRNTRWGDVSEEERAAQKKGIHEGVYERICPKVESIP